MTCLEEGNYEDKSGQWLALGMIEGGRYQTDIRNIWDDENVVYLNQDGGQTTL